MKVGLHIMIHTNYNTIQVIPSNEDIRKNFIQTFNTNDKIKFIYIINDAKELSLMLNKELIFSQNITIDFYGVSNIFIREKLEEIDSFMPNIISYMLLYSLKNNKITAQYILEKLCADNPLSYTYQKAYYYKYKQLLRAVALGELSSNIDVQRKPQLGICVLKTTNGDIVYSQQEFEEYLLLKTRLKQPQIVIYQQQNQYFMELDLHLNF